MTTIKRFTPDYAMHAARFEPFAREAEHGEFVKFSDYEALVSELASIRQINAQTLQVKLTMAETIKKLAGRVNALAVENQAIKAMNDCLSEELRGYESDGAFEGPNMHHLWWKAETPATSAALAAIQAQGVEKLIKLKMEQLACMHPDTHAFGATAESLRDQINELQAFATELREGK